MGSPSNPGAGSIEAGLQHQRNGRWNEARGVYQGVLDRNPDHTGALHALGVLEAQQENFTEALALLQKAAGLDPENPRVHGNLGLLWSQLEVHELALDSYRRAVALAPGYTPALAGIGNALLALGRPEEAARNLREVLLLNPEDDVVLHLLRSLEGQQGGPASDEYVRKVFDHGAATYEHHMRERLDYRVPETMIELLDRDGDGPARFRRLLDLGCGTGLMGRVLRERVDEVWGVDLSERMLEQAREGGGYERLEHGGLVEFLDHASSSFDLFTAADVLVYVGDLDPLLARIARRSLPGARLLLSAELHDGEGFALDRTGRFQHSRAYLEDRLAEHGFHVLAATIRPLRSESGTDIDGLCLLARSEPSSPGPPGSEGRGR